jgi:hypothetical protein
MKLSVIAALLVVIATSSPSAAQLTIVNPNHVPVPEQKASLLLSTACRVIAEKFRISKRADHQFSMTLVLGFKDEHYTADQGAYTLFLERWDERKFIAAMINLAIQRIVIQDRGASIQTEIQQRSSQSAPIPVTQLRESRVPIQPLGGQSSDCLAAITEARVGNIPCGPFSNPVSVSSRR